MFEDRYHPAVKKDIRKVDPAARKDIKEEWIPKLLPDPKKTTQVSSANNHENPYSGGRHQFMVKEDLGEISNALFHEILRQAGIIQSVINNCA